MGTFQSFEDMQVWQESRKLVRAIRAICKRENVRKDFGFIDQITRAARSVSANIAEGCEALNVADFITFLGYAKRSAGEVRSHLFDALEEKYVSKDEFEVLSNQTKKIGSMIASLVHYLQSIDGKQKRTLKHPTPQRKTRNQKPETFA